MLAANALYPDGSVLDDDETSGILTPDPSFGGASWQSRNAVDHPSDGLGPIGTRTLSDEETADRRDLERVRAEVLRDLDDIHPTLRDIRRMTANLAPHGFELHSLQALDALRFGTHEQDENQFPMVAPEEQRRYLMKNCRAVLGLGDQLNCPAGYWVTEDCACLDPVREQQRQNIQRDTQYAAEQVFRVERPVVSTARVPAESTPLGTPIPLDCGPDRPHAVLAEHGGLRPNAGLQGGTTPVDTVDFQLQDQEATDGSRINRVPGSGRPTTLALSASSVTEVPANELQARAKQCAAANPGKQMPKANAANLRAILAATPGPLSKAEAS